MPAGAPPDSQRSDDDPKANTGQGTLSIEVDADGAVTGTIEGALGSGTISGALDGEQVRAGLTPADAGGFSGMLLLEPVKGSLRGTLRASGPDAIRVREAAITLKRKK